MTSQDPTREEMISFLKTQTCGEPLDDFDAEEAIYWFGYSYHGGQDSNLYFALSTSPYNPGPVATGPEPGSMGEILYEALVGEYGEGE